ncbi:hypothetical protein MBLNU230_g1685t1 [Neophaeotheca triangularis]
MTTGRQTDQNKPTTPRPSESAASPKDKGRDKGGDQGKDQGKAESAKMVNNNIAKYNLDMETLQEYLQRLFGQSLFNIRLRQDRWLFQTPRLLTQFTVPTVLNMSQISLPFLLDAIAEPTGSANELGRFNNDDVNTQLLANQLNKKSSTLFSPEPEALVDLLDREKKHADDLDTSELESTTEREFSFEHLQDVHFTEEKVDEALEVVRANVNVFERLGDSYRALQESPHCPRKLLDACQSDLDQFHRKLNNLCSELKQQENRLCALVKLFASRRSLLHEILQYRNVQANNLMAERAQVTALRMEGMTKEMHTIAQKTKVETVSMRIITLVTLFFLPGTFISTLMSTPIVTFEPGSAQLKDRVIAVGALQFFVLVSLPLVLLTFVAWYLVYRRENRKEAARCKSFSDDLEKGTL